MENVASKIILLTHWRRALVAFAAGACLALTLAPLDILPAGFIAFVVLVLLLDGAVARPGAGFVTARGPAFWTGWWFGFGYFLAGLWWVGAAVLVDAANFAWALPVAVLGLPAILAIFYGLAAALAHLFWRDGVARIFALAAAFGGIEVLRGVVLTGFPWNTLGHTLASHPVMMQSAALMGVDGLAVVAVLVFAAPALWFEQRRTLSRRLALPLPLLLLSAMVAYGLARPTLDAPDPAAATLTVRLVQPAVPQDQKWDEAAKDAIFAGLMDLTKAPVNEGSPAPELIIWPETALPFLLEERPQALADIGDALAPGQMLLTGAIRLEGAGSANVRYYNSVLAINDEGNVSGAADKRHLVPFGEYLPLKDWLEPLGLRELAVSPGAFSAGTALQLINTPKGVPLLPLICYEAIFPVAVQRDAPGAALLVNVTNDAWYGRTPGPYQHFRQAQLRAVENGLPLARVANNGLSALVDPFGTISAGLALDARGHADGTVVLARIATLYAAHGVLIPLGMVAFMSVASMLAGLSRRKIA